MLIIDKKNKDYYDSIMGTVGTDKTIVYDRKEIILEESKEFPSFFRKKMKWDEYNPFYDIGSYHIKKNVKNYDTITPFIIGFCGKLHVGYKLIKKSDLNSPEIVDFEYDIKKIKPLINVKTWKSNWDDNINSILSHDPINIHRKFNTPIFLFDLNYNNVIINRYRLGGNKYKFIVNPMLKNYQFYKIFDTYTTFQEIQMFISGVLGNNEKNIIEIDDKHKIEQHGFDLKWSFRKEPEKKK